VPTYVLGTFYIRFFCYQGYIWGKIVKPAVDERALRWGVGGELSVIVGKVIMTAPPGMPSSLAFLGKNPWSFYLRLTKFSRSI
jgi:hypothetical protein